MLLNVLQCAGRPPTTKVIQLQISAVPRLTNPDLDIRRVPEIVCLSPILISPILTALRDLSPPGSLAFNQLTCLGTISNVPVAFLSPPELLGTLWLCSPSLSHICQAAPALLRSDRVGLSSQRVLVLLSLSR